MTNILFSCSFDFSTKTEFKRVNKKIGFTCSEKIEIKIQRK